MTVKQLIKVLKTHNKDLLVFVDGYEGGFEDIKHIKRVTVSLNVNEQSYYGPHEEDSKGKTKALLLR